jgi:hypothetical protein
MADGKLVEQGTHYELIGDENSKYSEMWRNYLREKEKGEDKDDNQNVV